MHIDYFHISITQINDKLYLNFGQILGQITTKLCPSASSMAQANNNFPFSLIFLYLFHSNYTTASSISVSIQTIMLSLLCWFNNKHE